MSRLDLPQTNWRQALPALLKDAPAGAVVVVASEEQRRAAHAAGRHLGRRDLQFSVEPPRAEPREWYFVAKRSQDLFEVQLLNDHGESLAEGEVRPETAELVIAGRAIPRPVIEAAKQRAEGHGEYVDAGGRLLDLWGRPQAA